AMRVEGGSSAPSASKVAGYSILQAESSKELALLLKDHPHCKAPGASIEVLEFLSMPGMPQKLLLVVQMLSLAVAVRALALGLFPAKGAPSVVIHVVLGALFAVALARTRVPAA